MSVRPTTHQACYRVTRLLFVALVALPPLLLHAAHLAPGQLPFLRDLSRTHLPFKQLAIDELRAGRLPLWNPAHSGGAPLFANPNFFHLHPVSILFLILPYHSAFSIGLASLTLLASIGTGLWLRERGASPVAAATGALVFALGGLGASLTSLYNLLASYASVPWALWAATRLHARPSAQRIALLALCLAATIAGGEPSAWGWAVLLGVALTGVNRAMLASSACAAALSLGLVALQLLPFVEMTADSVRADGFTAKGSSYHSLHPVRLLELVWPHPWGDPLRTADPSYRGREYDDGTPFFHSLYVGVTALALALIGGMIRARQRGLLFAVAVFSLLLALGRYTPIFTTLWTVLPPLHSFRYPQKLLLPFYLVLAVLVARGADRLAAWRRPLLPLVAVIIAVDLLVAHRRLVPATAAGPFLTAPAAVDSLTGHRTYFWLEPERWVPSSADPATAHLDYHEMLVPPAGMPFGVDYVLDPDPDILESRRNLKLARLIHSSHEDRARLLPIAVCDRVISPTPRYASWLRPIANQAAPRPHVYALDAPLPLARVAPATAVQRATTVDDAGDRLSSSAFDPRTMVVFEGVQPLDGAEWRAARWSRPTPSRLTIDADGPGLLIVAESFDRAWSAQLDGHPTPLAPANVAHIGIALPAGTHRIELTYRPRTLSIAWMTSIASVVLAGLLLARRRPG